MSVNDSRNRGVQLPADTTASALLHRLLVSARESYDDLDSVDVPSDSRAFRKSFAQVLPRFEAARAASGRRVDIARHIVKEAAGALVYRNEDGSDAPLAETIAAKGEPLELTTVEGTATPRLAPDVPWRRKRWDLGRLPALIDGMFDAHLLTPPAAEALRWTTEQIENERLDLRGHKFVVLGAAAELAPTPHLLAAGAEVLWIDLVAPTLGPGDFAGKLHHVEGGADLLTQPGEIVATIEAFAGGEPINVGMFAYAAGRGREWRLEAAMNTITRSVERGLVRSASVYISPTSAIASHPHDVEVSRGRGRPAWQAPLWATGLCKPTHVLAGDVGVARSIVQLQGASYQAAQYVAKILVAEAFACAPDEKRRLPRVSANVAPITNTSSMSEPVFQAGFAGASHFAVDIFVPESTRWLAALVMLHDLLHPDAAPDPAHPEAIFHRQLHGGVYSMPAQLEDAIRIAALIGMAKKPGLIPKFFKR